jgi:hypothetical protein
MSKDSMSFPLAIVSTFSPDDAVSPPVCAGGCSVVVCGAEELVQPASSPDSARNTANPIDAKRFTL